MNTQEMNIRDIHPYEKNPRRNDQSVDAVANSISEFGWQQPIVVDRDHIIIAGHTRYKAAKKLGLKKVPVVIADNLTPEQVAAYRIADNSTSEASEWDFDLLGDILKDLDYNMADFGLDIFRTGDGIDFSNLEKYKDQDHTEEYDEFLDKFKEKHTTDDCFTPPAVYEAVRKWATDTYGLEGREVVRPFYPGGDYESFDYPEGCVVIDNPPFSILKRIVTFYIDRGIDFFIFGDTRTLGWYFDIANTVLCGFNITYENGANVNTAFITNMGEDRIRVSARLNEALAEAQPQETADLNAYAYPDNLVTSMMLSRLAKYGSEFGIRNIEAVKKLDDGNEIYGGGALISNVKAEKVKAEKVKAEKVKAEKVKAEKVKAEKVKIKVELSERERELVRRLDMMEASE